ncbi:MAG: hypothetical protein JSV65_15060 [Armatimonadota bacterium]|nr:MAG: hypothetical protein JSV65_15060 [Armatimonadota bacterium]
MHSGPRDDQAAGCARQLDASAVSRQRRWTQALLVLIAAVLVGRLV